jgi:hypothetical protein
MYVLDMDEEQVDEHLHGLLIEQHGIVSTKVAVAAE